MKPHARMFAITFLMLSLIKVVFGQDSTASTMQAHFINVGQADATLLEFPCGAILIDAGAQDTTTQAALIGYLQHFFSRRTDLHNTLDLIVISHDHTDHDITLPRVSQTFAIKHYIDNGHAQPSNSGEPMQTNMEKYAQQHAIPYENFSFEQIVSNGNRLGLTDTVIEPLHCSVTSPQITVLSGRFVTKPAGWRSSDFSNENNHSLVIRVQFGKASFLFSGDLETAGDNQLVSYYGNNGLLDVDVWKVSHHAAVNGTSAALLAAITPQYAVILCGQWNSGIGPPVQTFSTYAYGHPRIVTLDALQQSIPGTRPQAITVKAASAQYTFSDYQVTKNIYATAWDGNVTINATSTGTYTVITNSQ